MMDRYGARFYSIVWGLQDKTDVLAEHRNALHLYHDNFSIVVFIEEYVYTVVDLIAEIYF